MFKMSKAEKPVSALPAKEATDSSPASDYWGSHEIRVIWDPKVYGDAKVCDTTGAIRVILPG